jgi:hypothetical protein
MEPVKGFYSLVQFCPDFSRLEVANVGVVLFVPEMRFIKARMARSNLRPARLLGRSSFSADWLNAAKASLLERLEVAGDNFVTPEDLDRFVDTRANKLILTRPRPLKVRQPEAELDRLFAELVDRQEASTRKESTIAELDQAFRSPTLAGRIRFDHKFTVPVVNRDIEVPYAYRNGNWHLIKPVIFGTNHVERGLELATEGDLIQRRTDSKLIVVPDLSNQPLRRIDESRKVLTDLFSFYGVSAVWEEQRADLIRRVESEAHPIPT